MTGLLGTFGAPIGQESFETSRTHRRAVTSNLTCRSTIRAPGATCGRCQRRKPRASIAALFRQCVEYGLWKVAVIRNTSLWHPGGTRRQGSLYDPGVVGAGRVRG